MKEYFLILMMTLTTLCYSQNFEVNVLNKDSKPLPYAYILVNNKPVTVTDSLGIAHVPDGRLHSNDTISVSYLGAIPSKVVFGDSMRKKKLYCFHIEENEFQLKEVTVKFIDYEKLFKKDIKIFPLLNYDCDLKAKMEAKITKSSQPDYYVSGAIMVTHSNENIPKQWAWFNPPIKCISISDTNIFWPFLDTEIHFALNHPYLTLWKCQNSKDSKAIYSYLGEKEGLKIYRIIYPKSWFKDIFYQTVLYVDKSSMYIKAVEIEAYTDNQNIDKTQLLYMKFDCKLFSNKAHKKQIYLPDNIEYLLKTSSKLDVMLKINDISLH